ncbi:glycohydrolase toxin TNT-related protein [Solwaraspora sp. WMMB335]|uniref:glycohydrolase toxin TNT-related protein n=1 Tax=Solwaraspora sp. WMMB335 TaxID=3404118 RepID=UPI003B92A8A5
MAIRIDGSQPGGEFPTRWLTSWLTDRPSWLLGESSVELLPAAPIAPWLGERGLGVQYYLPVSIQDLLDAGYLTRVG